MEFCNNCGIMLSVASTDPVPFCNPCGESHQTETKLRKQMESERLFVEYEYHRPPSRNNTLQESTETKKNNKKSKKIEQHIETPTETTEPEEKDEWTLVARHKSRKTTVDPIKAESLDTAQPYKQLEDQVPTEIRNSWERQQAKYKKEISLQDTPDISALVSGQRRKPDGSRYYVGGVDISFIKDNNTDACACLTVIQMPDLEMVYQRMEMIKLTQPYIPGFLAFREVPSLEYLFKKMIERAPQYQPDVILVDGNGILHPRGVGLASQLGVTLDVPTVGVAKTLMTAQGVTDDTAHKEKKKRTLMQAGDGFELVSKETGNTMGMCVRVHDNAPNPVYISVGHKISLQSAVWICLECSKYRIPEPVRRADLDSREYIRQKKTSPFEFIK